MFSEYFDEFIFDQPLNITIYLKNHIWTRQLYRQIFELRTPFDWFYYAVLWCLISIVLYGIWWLFYVPLNWTRDLTTIGYYHVKDKFNKGISKKDAINRIRRLRNVGDKLPPPFPNGWFCIAESVTVKKGQAINVNVLGQNLLLFRSEYGNVNVFDAYCPHLGANLGVGGIVRGNCIECPFHQWTFSGVDGQCISIPYNNSGIVPKSAKLKKWQSYEINGGIFIWHHAENAESWNLPVVNEVESGEWVYSGRNEYLINCHIQEIPENGADVSHLNAVHGPCMLAGSDLRFSRVQWASFSTHAWNANWQASPEEGHFYLAMMELKHSIRLFDKIELCTMDVVAKQIGPGYVQLHIQSGFGRFVILQTVTPVEPLVQKVIHRFYLPKGLSLFAKFAIWGESVMFERDIMVWNHKSYIDNPCLVKEDKMIKAYRTWYSQFYSQNSKSFSAAKDNLEW